MQKCLNCDSQITCSCKRRHASDGKLVCVNCISDYEASLIKLKEVKEIKQKSEEDSKTTP